MDLREAGDEKKGKSNIEFVSAHIHYNLCKTSTQTGTTGTSQHIAPLSRLAHSSESRLERELFRQYAMDFVDASGGLQQSSLVEDISRVEVKEFRRLQTERKKRYLISFIAV